ncbi:MAG: O-antigen ligase family protein [Synergistaceae bacterium]|nr:O-antigen ligase family protein [Synergistaceae bacterium]
MIKALIYLTVISSFIPASVLSINIGFMQISAYRIMIMLLPFACFLKLNSTFQINNELFFYNKQNNYSVLFMMFWLFYSLMSFLWSPSIIDTFKHTYFIACGVMCIFAFYLLIENVEDVYFCLLASTFVICIHGIIGWTEIFTGNYLIETEYTFAYAIQKLPVSAMYNVNGFATCMTSGVFLAFAVWKTAKSKLTTIYAFIVMISSFLIVIWSRSRANIYGLTLAIGVLLILSGKKIFVNIFLILILAFSTFFICGLFFPWITELFTDTVLTDITGINLEYGSDYVRINLIKNGLHFLLQNLLMGTGAGGIEHWMASEWIYETEGIINMHNWWMEILTAYGVFVFIGYLFFYVKLCFDMFKIYRATNNTKEMYLSLAMIGMLISFVISSVSSSSNIGDSSIWTFFAIAIAFQKIGSSYKQKNLPEIGPNSWYLSP